MNNEMDVLRTELEQHAKQALEAHLMSEADFHRFVSGALGDVDVGHAHLLLKRAERDHPQDAFLMLRLLSSVRALVGAPR